MKNKTVETITENGKRFRKVGIWSETTTAAKATTAVKRFFKKYAEYFSRGLKENILEMLENGVYVYHSIKDGGTVDFEIEFPDNKTTYVSVTELTELETAAEEQTAEEQEQTAAEEQTAAAGTDAEQETAAEEQTAATVETETTATATDAAETRKEVIFMMKMYTASVIDKETKKHDVISREYKSKAAFASDLKGNGYTVRFIAEAEKFDNACYEYYEKMETKRQLQKAKYESKKMIKEIDNEFRKIDSIEIRKDIETGKNIYYVWYIFLGNYELKIYKKQTAEIKAYFEQLAAETAEINTAAETVEQQPEQTEAAEINFVYETVTAEETTYEIHYKNNVTVTTTTETAEIKQFIDTAAEYLLYNAITEIKRVYAKQITAAEAIAASEQQPETVTEEQTAETETAEASEQKQLTKAEIVSMLVSAAAASKQVMKKLKSIADRTFMLQSSDSVSVRVYQITNDKAAYTLIVIRGMRCSKNITISANNTIIRKPKRTEVDKVSDIGYINSLWLYDVITKAEQETAAGTEEQETTIIETETTATATDAVETGKRGKKVMTMNDIRKIFKAAIKSQTDTDYKDILKSDMNCFEKLYTEKTITEYSSRFLAFINSFNTGVYPALHVLQTLDLHRITIDDKKTVREIAEAFLNYSCPLAMQNFENEKKNAEQQPELSTEEQETTAEASAASEQETATEETKAAGTEETEAAEQETRKEVLEMTGTETRKTEEKRRFIFKSYKSEAAEINFSVLLTKTEAENRTAAVIEKINNNDLFTVEIITAVCNVSSCYAYAEAVETLNYYCNLYNATVSSSLINIAIADIETWTAAEETEAAAAIIAAIAEETETAAAAEQEKTIFNTAVYIPVVAEETETAAEEQETAATASDTAAEQQPELSTAAEEQQKQLKLKAIKKYHAFSDFYNKIENIAIAMIITIAVVFSAVAVVFWTDTEEQETTAAAASDTVTEEQQPELSTEEKHKQYIDRCKKLIAEQEKAIAENEKIIAENEKLIEKLQHKTDAAAASAEIVTNIMNDLENNLTAAGFNIDRISNNYMIINDFKRTEAAGTDAEETTAAAVQ